MKKCTGNLVATQLLISKLPDAKVLSGLQSHEDPMWWKAVLKNKQNNEAYLRRWGSCLRREARKRGLL